MKRDALNSGLAAAAKRDAGVKPGGMPGWS
jgi:hypothetical protein